MVSLFLAAGVDTSTKNRDPDRLTVLHEAVLNGDEEMIALLLREGANTNARSKSGLTALHLAVQRKSIAMTNLLLEAGAEVSARSEFGMTVLHSAVQHGIVEIVDLLLKAGADTSATSSNLTRTIIHEAVVRRDTRMVMLLLEAGVGSSIQSNPEILLEAIRSGGVAMLGLLLDAGAHTVLKDPSIAKTMLHEAIASGSKNKARLLLRTSAVLIDNKLGWTALVKAGVADLLLKAGANTLRKTRA